jgi:phosphoribosylglycinamide formyltransferase-1
MEEKQTFKLAVLASGNGSNLEAIIDQLHGWPVESGGTAGADKRTIEVSLVVCNSPGAKAIARAREAGIDCVVIPSEGCESLERHDLQMVEAIRQAEADLVVLAGYMRLLHPSFLDAFPNRVINLHPALLPAFPGTTSIADAVEYGVKVTGVTVHYVDEGVDTGCIIAQQPVLVEADDTADTLAARIHEAEHELLPRVIRMIAAGKVTPPAAGSRKVRTE